MADREFRVSFNERLYAVSSIKKAAYRFIDRFAAAVDILDGRIECVITFGRDVPESEAEAVLLEFQKEVLDQDLRESIKNETEAVRNLLLAHVFSNTGLIKNE